MHDVIRPQWLIIASNQNPNAAQKNPGNDSQHSVQLDQPGAVTGRNHVHIGRELNPVLGRLKVVGHLFVNELASLTPLHINKVRPVQVRDHGTITELWSRELADDVALRAVHALPLDQIVLWLVQLHQVRVARVLEVVDDAHLEKENQIN